MLPTKTPTTSPSSASIRAAEGSDSARSSIRQRRSTSNSAHSPEYDQRSAVNALRFRSFTNGCDPPGVLVDWIEPGALDDAVFAFDSDDTEFKEAGHIFGQRTIVVAVAPFEVDGNRCVDSAYDARNDLLDECDRNGFAVPVTLRLRDSPAAGRNGLCARVQDRCGAGVPRIVQ